MHASGSLASGSDDAFTLEALSETVVLLRFGSGIDADLNARVHSAAAALHAARLPGVTDLVQAYATLAIVYSPTHWESVGELPWRHLANAIRQTLRAPVTDETTAPASVEIPVRYGADHGPDLDELARQLGMSMDDLVARHVAADYSVAMLGFAPGFPYLLGLDPRLHAARRATPRTRVPRGSVAIGGAQTGIYPSELPGGWQLIGRTPLALFDASRESACLLAPGDRVRFRAIDDDEFAELERAPSR
jgi:KipI family sensor histidine kinase inhibitor